MKIKKIILENFQSHKYTELDFVDTVNTIIGHSDSGKTAILRGIRWVLYNEPSGYEFIREGASEAKVTLVFQNNARVTRLRSSSKNQYIVMNSEGEEQVYEGFGVGVPEEVLKVTRIYKTSIDSKTDISINYASQLEGPFLLSEKDSIKAAAIGKLVGVDIVDKAMRNTLRDKKKISSHLSDLILDQERLEENLKKYEYLDDLSAKRDKLAILKDSLKEIQDKMNLLSTIQERFTRITEDTIILNNELQGLKDIHKINIIIHKINLLIHQLESTSKLSHQRLENRINQKNEVAVIEKFRSIDTIQEKNNLFSEKVNRLNKLIAYHSDYKTVLENQKSAEHVIRLSASIDTISTTDLYPKSKRYEYLLTLLEKYRKNQKNIQKGNLYLAGYTNINRIQEIVTNTNDILERRSQSLRILDKKQSITNRRIELQENINIIYSELNTLSSLYLECLGKIGTCPVCHQSIDQDDLKHVEEFLRES